MGMAAGASGAFVGTPAEVALIRKILYIENMDEIDIFKD